MLVVPHERGHVAVTQMEHAAMCAELAAAWGGGAFGPVGPADELRLAAAEHELGWIAWDRSPTLNPSTGLPFTVIELDLEEYIDFQVVGPRRLAERSPYAALLTVHHHMSFYRRPSTLGMLSARGRLIRSHLDRSAAYRDDVARARGRRGRRDRAQLAPDPCLGRDLPRAPVRPAALRVARIPTRRRRRTSRCGSSAATAR